MTTAAGNKRRIRLQNADHGEVFRLADGDVAYGVDGPGTPVPVRWVCPR